MKRDNNTLIYEAIGATFTPEQVHLLAATVATPEQIAARAARITKTDADGNPLDATPDAERLILADNLHTYNTWKAQGLQVRGGQKALLSCMLWRWTDKPSKARRDEAAALGKLMAALYFCSMSITLAGILYYRRARGGSGPWARFSVRGLNPALLLWAFVLIFAVGVVLEPLLTLLPELSLEVGRGFWTILSLVVFAPVFEELICRGVVLSSLRMRYGVVTAWLVSSLFFGVLHGQPAQVIGASVIGLILGFVYLATDSMWSVMILHALNNAVAYLAMVTGHGNALLIELVESRTLYVLIYIAALALTAVSGYMMLRTLRRMKAGDKNPSAA